jgi:hypothetical protein
MPPTTTCLLDAVKAVYINNVDPSSLSKDPVEGLKKKEAGLAKFTHEYLTSTILGYEELEKQLAATLGSNLTKLLLGVLPIDDILITLPTITATDFYIGSSSSSSSSSSSTENNKIYIDTPYQLKSIATGGNQSFEVFTYNWAILEEPVSESVSIFEVSDVIDSTERTIINEIMFSAPGNYILQMRLIHTYYETLIVTNNVYATVVAQGG